jgi:hypothetical protein
MIDGRAKHRDGAGLMGKAERDRYDKQQCPHSKQCL